MKCLRLALLGALLAPLAACASSEPAADARAAPTGAFVPVEALPDDYRRAAQSWKADGEEWHAWREKALTDPSLARFLVDNLIDVLVDSYTAGNLAPGGDNAGPFERARRDLAYLERDSAPVLVELVMVGDGVVSFVAGDTLAAMKSPRVAPLVLPSLRAEKRETRRRAAGLLGGLPNALEAEEEVRAALERSLLEDPEWAVRAEAARALGERGKRVRDSRATLRALALALRDADPAVVEAAARALAELGDPRALPSLVDALERLQHEAQRLKTVQAVQIALEKLSGQRGTKKPSEWRSWLRERERAGG